MAEANPAPAPVVDEDAERREKALIEASIAAKEEELLALDELRRDGGGVFSPRLSLVRTPPQSFSLVPDDRLSIMDESPPRTVTPLMPHAGEKRHLTSPEEVQEAMRRRVASRKKEVPPIGGTLTAATVVPLPSRHEVPVPEIPVQLATASVEFLADLHTSSSRGIMEAVKSKTSKLNKDEVAAIGAYTERMGAVITHLAIRLAAAEAKAVAGPSLQYTDEKRQRQEEPERSYAHALRLGRDSAPVPIARPLGPSVAIYPAEEQRETIKTADDTRRTLQAAVQPSQLGLQIAAIRRVGNAGVVVQTTSEAAAAALKEAVPATLRVAEPTARQPLIALTGVDKGTTWEQVVRDIWEQNLKDDARWTCETISGAMRLLFKRDRNNGRSRWICHCSSDLRRVLVDRGRLYIGWDVVEVTDHLGVTCCNRCQLYGHPEKYCRAKAMVCGNCGEEGHKNTECQAQTPSCATCRRFGRKGAHSHRTASRDCPARAHAEQRQVNGTNYG